MPALLLPVQYLTSTPAFYGTKLAAKEQLVQQIRRASEQFGFFQIINHAVPTELQNAVLQHSSEFFNLPLGTKEKYSKGGNTQQMISGA